jgi:transposase
MTEFFIGVDVSKDWLDVHHWCQGAQRITNGGRELTALARRAAREGAWVIFEATGGYDRALAEALETAGARFSRVNPRQARNGACPRAGRWPDPGARAIGVIGKTDRVDARLLADMGARLRPSPTEPVAPARRALQAQAARRLQLVEMRKQEATRLKQTADTGACADLRSHIAFLDRRIARIDARITELVTGDEAFADAERRLRTAPGIGPVVAAILIAELPELGRLDRRRIAALAGLAPVARDSGKRSLPRAIAGGRPVVRRMLYLAALQASRHHPRFKAFRGRLEEQGKSAKQAIIAVARKLLTILNAMIRDNADFAESPA